jgi:hypothetical protein
MSVHKEILEISKPLEKDAPELEYQAITQDTLSMFFAAIGGAILGFLLTLLALALINGGTLSFTGGERLSVFEAKLNRVDENLGTVSSNLDIVVTQAKNIQGQLGEVEQKLRAQIDAQNGDINQINSAITTLEGTKAEFDSFVSALSEALSSIQNLNAAGAESKP